VLKLKNDLQSTLAKYHQACEDLVQAKKKVLIYHPQVLPEPELQITDLQGLVKKYYICGIFTIKSVDKCIPSVVSK
jgi:hypothetical protein